MAEEPKAPAEGGPTSPEIESLKTEIETLKTQNAELGGKNEELLGRIDSLQASLDSALEEMALRGGTPSAEPEGPEGGEPTPPEGGEPGEGEPGKEVDVEKEIEKSIKEEEVFRTEQEKRMEHLELRQEVRDLDDELKAALAQYPNASEGEILLGLEDMSDEDAEKADVMELAKASHERRSFELEELKTKMEGEVKAQLTKEGEGGISVPQSPGAPPAPSAPAAPGAQPPGPASEDLEWGDALKKAKVEGGGA